METFYGALWILCMDLNFKNWPGFDLMTCDLYFAIQVEVFANHIFAENKHSCHWFPAYSISLLSKSFVNIIFYDPVNNKLKRWDNYLLFQILWHQKRIS